MKPRDSKNKLILIGLLTRIVIDTGIQIFYPFLRIISEGVGLTPIELGRLVSLRDLSGLTAPLFGTISEKRGFRYVMRAGLFLSAIGYFYIAIANEMVLFGLGMLLSGIGGFSYVPILQAYLSSFLPYNQRARGLGFVEYAWALSGIFGLFLVGFLMAVMSWRAPFFVLSGAFAITFFCYQFLPSARGSRKTSDTAAQNAFALYGMLTLCLLGVLSTWSRWRAVAYLVAVALGLAFSCYLWLKRARTPHRRSAATLSAKLSSKRIKDYLDLGPNKFSAWAAIATFAMLTFAGTHVWIAYGDWLSIKFALAPTQLGTAALLLGLADLGACILVSVITDRFGKRRSILWGSCLTLFSVVLLPWLDVGLMPLMMGLFFVRLCIEFTIVSNIPLLSEQAPDRRGKLMTIAMAVALLGPALAGWTGPWAVETFGVWGMTVGAVAGIVIAFLLTLLYVNDP